MAFLITGTTTDGKLICRDENGQFFQSASDLEQFAADLESEALDRTNRAALIREQLENLKQI